ncbi:hypothetical protein [Paenibacillus dendritiformis]|uniref:hypothetical protein n=1 Tax=Paenibacillus dendritiformis TaxID=130049 RepID=UPI00387E1F5A
MNRFRYEALVEEFPFLTGISFFEDVNDAIYHCEHIVIKRLDDVVLNMKPRHESASGSMVSIDDEQRVHFILDDGQIIIDAVHKEWEHRTDNDWFEKPGETILEAIHRIGVANQVKHIVIAHIGYDIVQHRSTEKWNVTVYKLPKYTTLSAEIEKAQQKAREKVRAEGDF